mmetsp:Transcript_38080/g.89176  ORF Transcript_38080/g.89176 Transcript_38080/m.89176 type:complete len:209 (-) Transcript_38080:36-662(-)
MVSLTFALSWLVATMPLLCSSTRPGGGNSQIEVHDAHAAPAGSSLVQEGATQQQGGWPGTLARGSVMLSEQLSDTLDTVSNHNRQLQEQIKATERKKKLLEDQLEEDQRMDKALEAQLQKIKDGRKATVSGLQSSLTSAHQAGHKTLEDGFKEKPETSVDGPNFLEESATETEISDSEGMPNADDFFAQRAKRLQEAGITLTEENPAN